MAPDAGQTSYPSVRKGLTTLALIGYAPCGSRAVEPRKCTRLTHGWRADDTEGDELEARFAPDREAWRGDVHVEGESWRGEPGDDAWRGGEHLADWPEASAGPEYWMYKQAAEGR